MLSRIATESRFFLAERTEMGGASSVGNLIRSAVGLRETKYVAIFADALAYDRAHNFAEDGVLAAVGNWIVKQTSLLTSGLEDIVKRDAALKLDMDSDEEIELPSRFTVKDISSGLQAIKTHIELASKTRSPTSIAASLFLFASAQGQFGKYMVSETDWRKYLKGLAAMLLNAMADNKSE